MPVFNGEPTLTRAINSVLNQTISNWELIIIDDKSIDNSLEIAVEFSRIDSRIKVIMNKINSGPAKSRNLGIQNSKFDYLAFLDADDYWDSKKLEICRKIKDYDLLYTNYIKVFGKNIRKPIFSKILNQNDVYFELINNGNPICTSSVVCKRDIVNEVGNFNEGPFYYAWEDFDLWLRIARKKYKFLHVNEYLVFYSIGDNNISTTKRKLINWKNFRKKYLKEEYLNQGIWVYKSIAINLLKQKKLNSSFPYIIRIIKYGNFTEKCKFSILFAILLLRRHILF